MKQTTSEIIDLILKIASWGLIILAILTLLLKWLKIIGSPAFEEVIFGWLLGVTGWIIELNRSVDSLKNGINELKLKLDMIWDDFRKRKRI